MTDIQRKAERYRHSKLKSAKIIAAEPERYPGLMQEWAAMVLARTETVIDPPAAGPLFKTPETA